MSKLRYVGKTTTTTTTTNLEQNKKKPTNKAKYSWSFMMIISSSSSSRENVITAAFETALMRPNKYIQSFVRASGSSTIKKNENYETVKIIIKNCKFIIVDYNFSGPFFSDSLLKDYPHRENLSSSMNE
ncbi:hypothetical protein DERF_010761 [Dermatophagoides farinae]|uniref:Uncharacterized protein n=1 Tax=Dermatophagoides farinae TaxID=6954 RepID=A0A922HQX2_DERFA|nr:hypothetical protein DERF_010761 [Dermatophagoides farinae]